ncbi:efflux RND transporter periplasmic adaptor subunit [Clostridium aestuarii]|uniref:Efflux RND transporter periplasmic adaptor subunit n=1 Tax=Clostridium aestuarii TaxID=338193 RepID=A0ABT4D1V5_9CLOT|nr:efflux RND transporter periplasmic adaptor subunit [Clostridium aestuarii]MCY6485236.1 efflux RND transporter periplasmic adaptor subunit [Clostridium aestuarii]
MKKRVLLIVMTVVLAMGLATGCGKSEPKAGQNVQQENYIPVNTEAAKIGMISNSFVISGKIVADKDTVIVPKMPGKVENVSVKVGDKVSMGNVLFTLEKTDSQNRVEQAKVGLDSASAQIEQSKLGVQQSEIGLDSAKASYEASKANYDLNYEKIQNAKLNLERNKKLYEEGIISKAQYEQAELAASDSSLDALKAQLSQAQQGLKQAESSMANAQIGIKQAQAGYDQAQVGHNQAVQALNDMTVTSPIQGIVASINIEKGEIASSAQPAVTIVNMDKVYLEVNVTEKLINKLQKGSEVKLEIPSAGESEFIGKIYTVSPSADSRTNLYTIKVEITNKDHKIKPGMFAKVQFNADAKKDVLLIKSEAVTVNNEKKVIYVINNGKAEEKEVEVGLDNGQYVEIKSGIQAGDVIIVKGQNYVENNSKIKVIKDDNEEIKQENDKKEDVKQSSEAKKAGGDK